MKYDRRAIMKNAWTIRRESGCTMSAALKMAWTVAKEEKMEEIKIEMIGSEKQGAWAQDILRNHYDNIVDTADRYVRRHEHALEKGDSARAEEAQKKLKDTEKPLLFLQNAVMQTSPCSKAQNL